MYLNQKDMDKILLHAAGNIAKERKAKGLKLNYVESVTSPERVYGMEYKGMDIRFTVKDRTLTVIEVK